MDGLSLKTFFLALGLAEDAAEGLPEENPEESPLSPGNRLRTSRGIGPSWDHVPGTKNGTRYLAPYPVQLNTHVDGINPVVPSSRIPGMTGYSWSRPGLGQDT